MNMNGIVNMVIRQITRTLINKGVTKGIDYAARRGKRPEDMTSAEREQAQAGRAQGKNARRMLRMGKRIGRF